MIEQPIYVKKLIPRNPAHPPGFVIGFPVALLLPSGHMVVVMASLHFHTVTHTLLLSLTRSPQLFDVEP